MRTLRHSIAALSFACLPMHMTASADVEQPVHSYSVSDMRLVSAQTAFERSADKASRDELFAALEAQTSPTVSPQSALALMSVMDFDTETKDWEALSASSALAVEHFRAISAEYPKLYFNARYAQAVSEIFLSEFDSDKPMRDLRREIKAFPKSDDLTPEDRDQLVKISSLSKDWSERVDLEQEADRLNDCAGSMIGTCGNPYYGPDHRRGAVTQTSSRTSPLGR